MLKVTNDTNAVELFADNEGGNINLNNVPVNRAIQQDVLNGAYRAYLYQINPWRYLNDITIHPDKVTTQKDFVNGNGISLNNCITQYVRYITSGFYTYDSKHIAYDFTAPSKGWYLFIVNFRPVGLATSCRLKIGSAGSDPIGGVGSVSEYAFASFPATESFNASETKKLLFEMIKCSYTIRMTIIKVSN